MTTPRLVIDDTEIVVESTNRKVGTDTLVIVGGLIIFLVIVCCFAVFFCCDFLFCGRDDDDDTRKDITNRQLRLFARTYGNVSYATGSKFPISPELAAAINPRVGGSEAGASDAPSFAWSQSPSTHFFPSATPTGTSSAEVFLPSTPPGSRSHLHSAPLYRQQHDEEHYINVTAEPDAGQTAYAQHDGYSETLTTTPPPNWHHRGMPRKSLWALDTPGGGLDHTLQQQQQPIPSNRESPPSWESPQELLAAADFSHSQPQRPMLPPMHERGEQHDDEFNTTVRSLEASRIVDF
jgi:hypothetical protein